MIQAVTNQQVRRNVVTELIIGYALPGRPVSMMISKTWGYITMAQALTHVRLQAGPLHKDSPPSMFWAQVVATVIAGTTQLGVQKNGFICLSTEVFRTASTIWGVIGPARQFSQGQVHYALVFFFLIGFACPIISYLIGCKGPNSIIRYVNFPVIFSRTGTIPPAMGVNYVR
ncbi:OPT oligopeptide transporter protein-domain-containing protein [Armillaria novae-zelandiae]|uniref:OPT oligopeptide transporter protein-domain-containing protein n=1 Tax=Armillaria novae-zelandiae TaxID=153914 RepID=A0AA39NL51_9AGAR|nr:OPT oligopeptide transporter protein-domain-containing protein [Armillaria novae-zelandiae]